MNRSGRRRDRQAAAFTLVEVLVAISILSISMLGVQAMLLGLTRATGGNASGAIAMELAQTELEDLRSLSYDEVDSRTSVTTVGGTEYTISSLVGDGVPAPQMKQVTTTVSWIGYGDQSRELSLETIYAETSS